MHPEIVRDGPGSCPICGMALEPMTPTADAGPNPELIDMTRRFWIGAALAVPVLVPEMGRHLFGIDQIVPAMWNPWLQGRGEYKDAARWIIYLPVEGDRRIALRNDAALTFGAHAAVGHLPNANRFGGAMSESRARPALWALRCPCRARTARRNSSKLMRRIRRCWRMA